VRGPIEIVVDELVVRGLPSEAARAAAASLEAQLTALAGAHEGVITPNAEDFERLGTVVAPSGRPAALGEAVAGAVWERVAGVPR
jgi:hypothetical protein